MMVEQFPMVLSGAPIGLSMAAPIGPMSVLCINRTFAEGMTIGVITGLGASTVRAWYGAAMFQVLSEAVSLTERNGKSMSFGGVTLMILFSLKLLRARPAVRSSESGGTLHVLVAYGSAVALHLSNPLTVVLLMAAMTSIFGTRAATGPNIGLSLLGQFAGSALWWLCLSSATSLLRGKLTAIALKSATRFAAAVRVGFGLLAAAHA